MNKYSKNTTLTPGVSDRFDLEFFVMTEIRDYLFHREPGDFEPQLDTRQVTTFHVQVNGVRSRKEEPPRCISPDDLLFNPHNGKAYAETINNYSHIPELQRSSLILSLKPQYQRHVNEQEKHRNAPYKSLIGSNGFYDTQKYFNFDIDVYNHTDGRHRRKVQGRLKDLLRAVSDEAIQKLSDYNLILESYFHPDTAVPFEPIEVQKNGVLSRMKTNDLALFPFAYDASFSTSFPKIHSFLLIITQSNWIFPGEQSRFKDSEFQDYFQREKVKEFWDGLLDEPFDTLTVEYAVFKKKQDPLPFWSSYESGYERIKIDTSNPSDLLFVPFKGCLQPFTIGSLSEVEAELMVNKWMLAEPLYVVSKPCMEKDQFVITEELDGDESTDSEDFQTIYPKGMNGVVCAKPLPGNSGDNEPWVQREENSITEKEPLVVESSLDMFDDTAHADKVLQLKSN